MKKMNLVFGINLITIAVLISNCAVMVGSQHWMFPGTFHQSMCIGMMDGIVFPDNDNCDMFVQCQGGVTTSQRCQTGTLFDLSLYYCMISHSVDCGSRRQPVSTISTDNGLTASHHSLCRNVRSGTLIANPTNCRAFVECQQNLRLDRECAANELYESHSGVCLGDFLVDCGERPIIPSNADASVSHLCSGQRNGIRVADPRDCRRYLNCHNQQSIGMECTTGQLFEEMLGSCISEVAVNCGSRPQLSSKSDSSVVSQNTCIGLPAGTRISNPNNCHSYFECRDNRRLELTCSTNEAFDVFVSRCRPRSAVNCGSRNDAQQNAICQGQPNGRRMGNPNNCRGYIECQVNSRIDGACENGQLFDSQSESCLDAHLVRCGARGLAPDVPQLPEDFFPPCPSTGVSYRSHPHDCEIYFICAHGQLIQHSCARGIHFNPETLQCDFVHNARCRVTRIVIPQAVLLPDCSTGEDFFPNLVNCKQYYICVDKKPQLMNCPSGYLWDNRKLACAKSESEICARSFNASSRTFSYGKPRPHENKN